jgi:lipopolysaccharide exporter
MSLGQKVIKGSASLLSIKLIQRGVGLISTLVLARLLTPDDFGIVAIATLIVWFFDAISESGIKQYIIQKEGVVDEDLNTAWTLNLIIKILIWVFFVFLVPLISEYYSKPELNYVLWCISLILPFRALGNPGLYLCNKELFYKPIFMLALYERLSGVIVIIILAITIENYWAMILGSIFSQAVLLLGGYLLHPFRPRLSIKNIRTQWDFMKWMLPRGIFGYIRAEIDTIIISSLFSLQQVGAYNMMKNLTAMVGKDLIAPAIEPIMSSFSKSKDDSDKIKFQLNISLWLLLLVTIPIVFFIFNNHKIIIQVLLGDQWTQYSNIFRNFSVLIIGYAILGNISSLLIAFGKVKVHFIFDVISFIIFVGFLTLLNIPDTESFAIVRSLLVLSLLLAMTYYVKKMTDFSIINLVVLALPAIIAAFMSSLIISIAFLNTASNVYLLFFIKGSLYISIYIVFCFIQYYFLREKQEIVYLKWLFFSLFKKNIDKS